MSAENEEGKSFLRTLVSWRWCCCFSELLGEFPPCGVTEIVHASSLRKAVLLPPPLLAIAGATVDDCCTRPWKGSFEDCILRLRARSSSCLDSSHVVSHAPASKSGWDTMARSSVRLVCTPVMKVSSRARLALLTTSSHVRAVMMILPITLSKSELT